MNGDPKEVSADLYSLEFADDTKPGHEFILKQPLWKKDLWKHKAAYESDHVSDKEYLIDGNKAVHTRYTKIPKPQRVREHRLTFPSSMELTDKFFLEAGEDQESMEVDQKVHSYWSPSGQNDTDENNGERMDSNGEVTPHFNVVSTVVWLLIDLSSGVELEVVKKKKGGAEKLAASLKKGKKQRLDDDSD